MPELGPTDQTRIKRNPDRGQYDRDTIHAIIDEGLVCHVGFVVDNRPIVIPTIHARDEDRLIFHGAKASRMLKHMQAGNEVCVTITLLDGLVLARSVFHHSMNYRSVVVFGSGTLITDEEEKLRCLEVLTEHLVPGRWDDARIPNQKELNATSLIAMDISEASAKIRNGPPNDDDDDYSLTFWAGVLPVSQHFLAPVPDDRLKNGIVVPDYISTYQR